MAARRTPIRVNMRSSGRSVGMGITSHHRSSSPRSTRAAGQLLSQIRHMVDMNTDNVISQNEVPYYAEFTLGQGSRLYGSNGRLHAQRLRKGATHLPMPLPRNGQTHKIDCPTACPEPDPWLCRPLRNLQRRHLLPIARCDIICSGLSSSRNRSEKNCLSCPLWPSFHHVFTLKGRVKDHYQLGITTHCDMRSSPTNRELSHANRSMRMECHGLEVSFYSSFYGIESHKICRL